tara:strand:+ start:204 stop:536 length:333 start_codon:yes stop_codon:yes gene_type:complete
MKGKLNIKPLSVNQAWKGKRYKTDKYKRFEIECLLTLKASKIPEPPYHIALIFGMSNVLSDVDNPIKGFLDVMQRKFCFNDRDVYKIVAEKVIVKKGEEFIKYEMKHYEK